jgi:PAS domain S-box-containing protein
MSRTNPWWRFSSSLPLIVLLNGLLVTVAASRWQLEQTERQAQIDFHRIVDRLSDDIRRRLRQPIYGLRGAAGLYAANLRWDRESFKAYVASRDLKTEFPGVRGLGFIQRVGRDDLDAFVAAARADGEPRFEIRQLEERNHSELYVVKYIEPALDNQGALGLDVGSEAERRRVLERTVLTGEPTLSGAITLVQDAEKTPGFLLNLPLYRGGRDPGTPALRQAELAGFLSAPIVAREMFKGVAQAQSNLVRFELSVTPDPATGGADAGSLVFDSGSEDASASGGSPTAAPLRGDGAGSRREGSVRYQLTDSLDLVGQAFVLHVESTPSFEAGVPTGISTGILLLGSLLSMVLAAFVSQQQRHRQRAEATARGMTIDLERLALVAQRTSNAVIITDAALRITWVNEGFTRLYGYSAEEALGQTPGALLGHADTPPSVVRTLLESAQAGVGCRVEVVNQTQSGQVVFVDTEIQPTWDAQGKLIGFVEVATDITASKQAEQELALRSQALANIVEGTGAGTWEWDLESGETVVNERWASMLGLNFDALRGHKIADWVDFVHPDDLPSVRQSVKSHLDGETAVLECETRFWHKTGKWLWVLTRGRVVSRGVDGRARRLAGTHIDISDRKQAEAERAVLETDLRMKNELVDTVLENLPCGLSVVDGQRQLVLANAEFKHLLDLPDSLFSNGPLFYEDVIRFNAERGEYGTENPEELLTMMIERARQPVVPHRFERQRPDGTFLEVRGAPMPGGGFVTTYTDITARKQAEASAERSARILRSAMEAVDEGFVLYDADDRLVFCNERYRQLYASVAHLMVPGVSFETLIRQGAQHGHYADAIGRVDAWVDERMAAHLGGNSTLIQKHDNGRTLRIVERKMDDGHIVGFRIDITELVQATEAAQAASAAKSEFLANMSHEIRTPMNAILGMLKLLRRTELNARQSDYATKTEGAARSLLGLLNDILDFSKIEAGKVTLELRPFRLGQMLDDLSVIVTGNLEDKPLELRFEIDPALPTMLVGDALRLQQVLTNLVGNAIKFTAEGEVVMSMKMLNQTADVVTVAIAVRDTGIGIAPENQARIFNEFTQAEASTTRRYGGTGLGVAISRRFVALMGGELKLDSVLGQGSCFHFQLTFPLPKGDELDEIDELAHFSPLQPAPQGEQGGSSPEGSRSRPPPRLRGLRILLAEDNLNNQQVARELLQDEGAEVLLAQNGQEALQAVASAIPMFDAVLMDLQMPVMDGFTTTGCIRRDLGLQGLPIIAMTANAMPSDRAKCLAAGMNGHVGKPFDLDHLVSVLLQQTGRTSRSMVRVRGKVDVPAEVSAAARAGGIQIERAVQRMGGQMDLYHQMLRRVLVDLAAASKMLGDVGSAQDAPALGALLHTVKGLAATMGAEGLAAQLAHSEQTMKACVKDGKLEAAIDGVCADVGSQAHEAVASCMVHFEALLMTMDQSRQSTGHQGSGPPKQNGVATLSDTIAMLEGLRHLAGLLRESDMSAVDALARLPRSADSHWITHLRALDGQVAALEFEPALETCERLIDAMRS